MNELLTEIKTEEYSDMGSLNHSALQVNLAYLLKRLGTFSVYTELSLDTSKLDKSQYRFREEIKPDVCIYPKRGLSRPYDILKMTEMPLLAIEVLSPRQGLQEIIEKFDVYFALGVRSCWLIDPTTAIVAVYRSLDFHKIFAAGEVVDDVIGIRLPFDEIFDA
jgi:Uma2 family endonuclease